jgi:DNA polymerase III epsilon subunit family exonuclease
MRLIFCDLETTGLSREKHDIIEVAAVVWDNTTNTIIDTYKSYIKPGSHIPALITELTGISDFTVKDARRSWEVLPEFYAWIVANQGQYFVGHNFKSFDSKFLAAQVDRYNITLAEGIKNLPIIDTLQIARELNKNGKIKTTDCKQETLARYFGIQYDAHEALNDVKALTQIYMKFRELDPRLM